MKTLFINATAREDSRTLMLADAVLENISGEIKEINLYDLKLKPFDWEMVQRRMKLIKENKFDDEIFMLAKDFASADKIVIAAPVWDLSFPSILKVYFEHVSAAGVMFKYTENGPKGLAKAKELIYVTTSGGNMILNYGFEYVKALATIMYGINDVKLVYADGLDIWGADVDEIIESKIKEIEENFK